jgi:hypothetical protein
MVIYFKASSSVHYIILHVIGTRKPFSSLSPIKDYCSTTCLLDYLQV